MIKKFFLIIRYILLKLNRSIHLNGFVIIQSDVKIILEKNAILVIGDKVKFKNNTIIYVKKNAFLEIGSRTSTGHHTEISCGGKLQLGMM